MTDHSPSTDERASLAQPSQSSSPLECTSHLGFSLVTATGRSPVTVEAEFEPAPEAEKDARERLGLKMDGEPRTIEALVAVRYPASLETAYDLWPPAKRSQP